MDLALKRKARFAQWAALRGLVSVQAGECNDQTCHDR
jgi:hypothetical protein